MYLFEYIFHGDSKYNHEIQHFLIPEKKIVTILNLSSANACRVESVMISNLSLPRAKMVFIVDTLVCLFIVSNLLYFS